MTIFEEHPPLHQRRRARRVHRPVPRARGEGRHSRTLGRDAGRGVVHGVADPRSRRQGDEQPRRQDDRRVAQDEPRRHDPGQAALRRPEQLRRRPDARQAGPERPLGHRLAEGIRSTGRDAPGAVTASALSRAPDSRDDASERDAARAVRALRRFHRRAVRAARPRASGCRGVCCTSSTSRTSRSRSSRRTFATSSRRVGGIDPFATLAHHRAAVLPARRRECSGCSRASRVSPLNSLLATFGLTAIIEACIQTSGPPTSASSSRRTRRRSSASASSSCRCPSS